MEVILEAAREAAANAPAEVLTWIADDDEKLSQFLASVEEGMFLLPFEYGLPLQA